MENFNGTKGTWKSGKGYGAVVSDKAPNRQTYRKEDYESEFEYYGGYLICESIPTEEDKNLITAAPELLEALIDLLNAYKESEECERGTIDWDKEKNYPEILKAESAIKKALGIQENKK